MPAVFLSDGEPNLSDPFDPLTGSDIDTATVTAINEATGQETPLPWTEPTGNMRRGSYGGYQTNFPHPAGDEVSIRIEVEDQTVTGEPTVTPDAVATITNPAHMSSVTAPFDITWTMNDGQFPASHVFVFINSEATGDAYMDVVPASSGTYTIDSSKLPQPTGSHKVTVWPTNLMSLGSDVVGNVHVKSTEVSYTHTITVM
jgi:hypothetical protein